MSTLSAQVDELRGLAGDGSIEWVAGPIRASLLRDIADMLDESEVAELHTQLADVTESMGRVEERCAKLRDLAVLQSVIFRFMSTCGNTECQACPVKAECDESVYLEGILGIDDKEASWRVQWRIEDAMDIQTENKKLRELVRDWWSFAVGGADSLPDWNAQQADLESRMRELEIEVDE